MPRQHFRLLGLPVELRTKVYRCILISKLDYGHGTEIWRPIAADDGIFKIGLFEKDTALPLLLVNRQVHAEAVVVLYGDNTFIFHISGFAEGPLAFLDRLPPRYLRLLRRVYIRTGYYVRNPPDRYAVYSPPTVEEAAVQSRQDLMTSVALVRQAWPMKSMHIHVDDRSADLRSTTLEGQKVKQLRGFYRSEEWLASSWYLWEMVTTESAAEEPRREFRCIDFET